MDLVDNAYQWNPFAPVYFAGLNLPPPEETGYELHHYEYVYNLPAALTANQFFQDSIAIHPGSDFYLNAFYNSFPAFANKFSVQITDQTGYQLFTGFLDDLGIFVARGTPTRISPPHPFAQSTKMILNFQDLGAGTPVFQLVFLGFTRQKAQ